MCGKRVLYIEQTNFIDFPAGGTTTFANALVSTAAVDFLLVGICEDTSTVGHTRTVQIGGRNFDFFGLVSKDELKRSRMPARLTLLMRALKYGKSIRAMEYDVSFSRTPQFALLGRTLNLKSLCFVFAGLANSVSISKFKYLRVFAALYEWLLIKSLKDVAVRIGAAASPEDILEYQEKTGLKSLEFFPTFVDSSNFAPSNAVTSALSLDEYPRIAVVGKLIETKGWRLVLQVATELRASGTKFGLSFIGDGPDKSAIVEEVTSRGLGDCVKVEGAVGRDAMPAVYHRFNTLLITSEFEGWSNALLEALASGLTVISTKVSGHQLISSNPGCGYVLQSRNANEVVAIIRGMRIQFPNECSCKAAQEFSVEKLGGRFIEFIRA